MAASGAISLDRGVASATNDFIAANVKISGATGPVRLSTWLTAILLNCENLTSGAFLGAKALRLAANAHLYGGPPPPAYPPSPVLWYSVVPIDLWPVGLVVPARGLASPAVLKRSSQPAGSQP
jgi:hypothetical protein